jgi:hypothetical protein
MELSAYHPQYFTAIIVQWHNLFKHDKYKDVIVGSLAYLARENIVNVSSFVIMNNHTPDMAN